MKKKLDAIKTIVNEFDKDFDDPANALQKIADILKIDKTIDDLRDCREYD